MQESKSYKGYSVKTDCRSNDSTVNDLTHGKR